MSQTLVIHDNSSLVDLLGLNLPTFVGTDVISKKNFKEAQTLLEVHPGIHLIVCADRIGDEATADLVHQMNAKSKRPSDLIVIGERSKVQASAHIVVLASTAEVKQMVQAAAKLLKVTPKKMMEMPVPDYYPVAATLCLGMRKAPCDIFVLKGESEYLVKYHDGDSVNATEINKLVDGGHSTLYVPADKRLRFVNNVTTDLMSRLNDKAMSTEEKVAAVSEAQGMIQEEVLKGDYPLSKPTEELISTTIRTCIDIAKKDSTVAGLLKKLFANRSSYIYRHTQLIIYLTQHILSNLEWGSSEQKEKLAFVAFFHDISLTDDKQAKFNSDFAVTSDDGLGLMEKEAILKHARSASEIVQRISTAPIGADVILMQHHGMTSGQGFAKSFTNSISPLAIVFIIAEETAHMILEFDGMERAAAHKQEIIEKLNHKFPRSNYQRIIETIKKLQFD